MHRILFLLWMVFWRLHKGEEVIFGGPEFEAQITEWYWRVNSFQDDAILMICLGNKTISSPAAMTNTVWSRVRKPSNDSIGSDCSDQDFRIRKG